MVGESRSFRNPLDSGTIAFTGLCSLIALAFTIFELQLGNWGKGGFSFQILVSIIVGAFFSIFFISLGLVSQIVLRPYNVEVGHDIRLDWKFKESTTHHIDSIINLFIEPKARQSAQHRRTGGSVGITGQRKRIGLSYEIVKAIEDRYVEEFGHVPPLPQWGKR